MIFYGVFGQALYELDFSELMKSMGLLNEVNCRQSESAVKYIEDHLLLSYPCVKCTSLIPTDLPKYLRNVYHD